MTCMIVCGYRLPNGGVGAVEFLRVRVYSIKVDSALISVNPKCLTWEKETYSSIDKVLARSGIIIGQRNNDARRSVHLFQLGKVFGVAGFTGGVLVVYFNDDFNEGDEAGRASIPI